MQPDVVPVTHATLNQVSQLNLNLAESKHLKITQSVDPAEDNHPLSSAFLHPTLE